MSGTRRNRIGGLLKILLLCLPLAQPFQSASQTDQPYEDSLEAWHRSRLQELRSKDGWLNLAGLFWLVPGAQGFGSSPDDRHVFPAGKMPPNAGVFLLTGDTVRMSVNEGVTVYSDGSPVREHLAFHPGIQSPPVYRHGSLTWTVIRRADRFGIRLRDLEHPSLATFKGIERYPVDSFWRIAATLEKPLQPAFIPVTNVLGQTTLQPSPGRLRFELQGKTYALDALQEGDSLFIIVADETNGMETYPSGRYLYAPMPSREGTTTLDFNKAVIPPCAFTPYATCPLPPAQNRLAVRITAGEKDPDIGIKKSGPLP